MRIPIIFLLLFISSDNIAQNGNVSIFHRLIIYNSNDEIMIVRFKDTDIWVTPGFYQDSVTLINEGLHEIASTYGITVTDPELKGVFSMRREKEVGSEMLIRNIYRCSYLEGEIKTPDFLGEVKWVTIDEALETISYESIKLFIKQTDTYPNVVWGGAVNVVRKAGEREYRIIDEFYPLSETAQKREMESRNGDGFYMNWNMDRSFKTIKPSIKISEWEAKKVNCYHVSFDSLERVISVKHYVNGAPSDNGNYGAFELVREYFKDKETEQFRNRAGELIENTMGIGKREYLYNDAGYWVERVIFNNQGEQIEVQEIATISLKRNTNNERLALTLTNFDGDTLPYYNEFKYAHFDYFNNGRTYLMKNKLPSGGVQNSDLGYAKVFFEFDENGQTISEEFRDAENNLIEHPDLGYAKIIYRGFNKFGKPSRAYFYNSDGYPIDDFASARISYLANMDRRIKRYYGSNGEPTEDPKGIHEIVYKYDNSGKRMGTVNYNLRGLKVSIK